jgi:hypothetical protein
VEESNRTNANVSLQEVAEKLGHANRKFSEIETQNLQVTAELKQANAGLSAKNEVLERQVKESLADYKQELQILEGRYLKATKDYRADVEASIKRLEQDLFKYKAKVQLPRLSISNLFTASFEFPFSSVGSGA